MHFAPRLTSAFACIVCAASLCAQNVPAPIPAAPLAPVEKASLPSGSITGTVICSDTHRPARGAMIIVSPLPSEDGKEQQNSSSGMSRVAMDGVYTAHNLQPGEYSVIAILPGYLSPFEDITAADMSDRSPARMRALIAPYGSVVVHAGSPATFDITLERGAAISGQVSYADGAPATQISIDFEDVNAKPVIGKSSRDNINVGAYLRQVFTHQSQSTDDQGHFRIAGIKPGSYRVVAVQASPSSSMQEGFEGVMGLTPDSKALRFYSGNTIHKKSARVYDLRAGDEVTGIDIVIPPSIFHRVHGTLTAKDGRTINTASLVFTDTSDDSTKFSASVSEDGTFDFATVPSGTYKLAASGAKIVVAAANTQPGTPFRYAAKHTTNAFADGDTSVVVNDSDLDDVTLTLNEVPVPPDADKQNMPGGED